MKKKILILGIAFMGIVGAYQLNAKNSTEFQEFEVITCKHGRCSKIKKDGYQCKNCSQEGSYYCWSHNN